MSLTLIRHGQSAYNVLRTNKEADEEYQKFVKLYNKYGSRPEFGGLLERLAKEMRLRYALGVSDYETPLTEAGERQAVITGTHLCQEDKLPDIIFYSPYVRTRQTLEHLCQGWPKLADVRTMEDDRIREQEHGLALLYNDKRIFHVFHPEQRALSELQGPYWYQYPQGESVSMVRDRVRSIVGTLIREYSGQRVMMITHNLTILSIRAIMERLTPEEFIALNRKNKPVNCGVTNYLGNATVGRDGRLELEYYNRKLY